MRKVLIIGAGLTGLRCGFVLQKRGVDVQLLEASDAIGGKIASTREEGYLLESGPNSLRIDHPATAQFLDELGLTDRVIEASKASKRALLLRNGKLVALPRSLGQALRTPLLSPAAKLRALGEPFIRRSSLDDESVREFFSRRLGRELHDYLVDPFMSGIYAGDTAALSIRHTFGGMWKSEQSAGSLLRGSMKSRGQKRTAIPVRTISFVDGIGELTLRLAEKLDTRISLNSTVHSVAKRGSSYLVQTERQTIDADTVICTVPAFHAAQLLSSLAPEVSSRLLTIDYPPIAICYLGCKSSQFADPVEGFGCLIPSAERRAVLGIIYSSSAYSYRAPAGHTLLTVLMGGAHNKPVASWNSEKIVKTATEEVGRLLQPAGTPSFASARLWKQAIPQYHVGYQAVLDELERFESQNPGFYLAGNYRGGVAMTSCIKNATALSKKLTEG